MKSRVKKYAGKRLLAGVLAVSMLLGAVGCGKGKDKSESGDGSGSGTEATVDVKNCTFEQDSDFSFDGSLGLVSKSVKVGDNIVLLSQSYQGDTDEVPASEGNAEDMLASEGDASYLSEIYVMPASGGETKKIYEVSKDYYVDNMTTSGDNIALLVTNEKKHELRTIDLSGNEVASVNLAAVYKNSTNQYVSAIKVTDDGDIVAVTEQNIVVLGSDGSEKKVIFRPVNVSVRTGSHSMPSAFNSLTVCLISMT